MNYIKNLRRNKLATERLSQIMACRNFGLLQCFDPRPFVYRWLKDGRPAYKLEADRSNDFEDIDLSSLTGREFLLSTISASLTGGFLNG